LKPKIVIEQIKNLSEAAKTFVLQNKGIKKFAFYADMGYGKTTFIKAIANCLGVQNEVTSPTYGLINEYHSKNGYIYHIDLYRLNSIEECLDIGIENYLYDEHYCFIEWPQIIEPILPATFKKVQLEINSDKHRLIYF